MKSGTVLLTGMTGFVGGALAVRLLADGHRLCALVRADNLAAARERIRRSLARFVPSTSRDVTDSIEVVVGDLAADATYDADALAQVTHVVHAAACTSFASRREVWRTNVEGTLKLATSLISSSRLRRFLHVGTAYCCGDRPQPVVREEDSPRAVHAHVNAYAGSKARAELLLAQLPWAGRLMVARPSIVIGHTALGTAPSSSLYWYYRAMAALRCGPFHLDDRRDIVPVDYVADALAFLLTIERPRHSVYHVSAGSRGSTPVRELVAALAPAGASESPWRRVPAAALAVLADELRPLVGDAHEASKMAQALAACARFGELGVQYFDNTRLVEAGFPAPPSLLDYLDVCIATSARTSLFAQMVDDA